MRGPRGTLLDGLEAAVVGLVMAAMLFVVVRGVLFRYVLGAPVQWTEEVALGLFVWLVFVGAAAAHRRGGHVGVDALITALPPPLRRLARIAAHLVVLAVAVGFVVIGWSYARAGWTSYAISAGYPLFWVYVSLPLGGGLVAWRAVQRLIAELGSGGREVPAPDG